MFMVWLFHPATCGATFVYNMYILPNMKQYEKHIIAAEDSIGKAASNVKAKIPGVGGGDDKKEEWESILTAGRAWLSKPDPY